VQNEAIQTITLHQPIAPETWTWTIAHEDVTFQDITSAFCRECPHEWTIAEAGRTLPDTGPPIYR
jgi:hypothetical protein